MKKFLLLENGMSFEGESFGADSDTTAELVFSTSVVGYTEALTDPRFAGQALCLTFPVVGNYGVCEADCDSDAVHPAALIVREYCDDPSNFRCEETLDAFLKKHGVPGISGVDTRLLTKILRENGSMNALLTSDPASADLDSVKAYRVSRAAERVSVTDVRLERADSPDAPHVKVALLDLGVTKSTVSKLNRLGCDVYVLPYHTSADAILALSPDGLFVSGGPGNPADYPDLAGTLAALLPAKLPTMAVGLGHQLLAMANGMSVGKLPHGHRGSNHPVRDTATGHLYITRQNHGFAVTEVNDTAAETFVNAGDGTNEGLAYKNIPAFSVQFAPDTAGISAGTEFLYENFVRMMKK